MNGFGSEVSELKEEVGEMFYSACTSGVYAMRFVICISSWTTSRDLATYQFQVYLLMINFAIISRECTEGHV